MPSHKPSLTKEVLLTLQRTFRELVPAQANRYPLTWKTAPFAYAYVIPLLFMAYLCRRRDTQLIRLLLLPTCVVMCIRCTYAYDWFDPDYYFFTWLRGLSGMTAVGLSVDLALFQAERMKVGEKTLPAMNEPSPSSEDNDTQPSQERRGFLPQWLLDSVETLSAMRGIGWNFGRKTPIPREFRSLQRKAFLRTTARIAFKKFIIADFFESCIKLIPGVGSTAGGSMFFHSYPFFKRYMVSTGIQFLAAFTLVNGVELLNLMLSLVGVGLLGQSPTEWPYILDEPFDAESLHDFWSSRWHQTLRRVFIVLGGKPGKYFYGRTGMLFGTFFASGIFHEAGTYLMGRGIDYRVVLFFILQGFGVWLEEWWRWNTGKTIHGVPGTLWTYFWIIGLGQMCMDAWFTRGLAGAIIIPAQISPARRVIFPAFRFVMRLIVTILSALLKLILG